MKITSCVLILLAGIFCLSLPCDFVFAADPAPVKSQFPCKFG